MLLFRRRYVPDGMDRQDYEERLLLRAERERMPPAELRERDAAADRANREYEVGPGTEGLCPRLHDLAAVFRRDPDAWLNALPGQGHTLRRRSERALSRRVHLPDGRPHFRWSDILPWRRSTPSEVMEIRERPASALPAKAAAMECGFDALLGEARGRARVEVEHHVCSMPRGRERASKFAALTLAHEIRTTRVVETELRREQRRAGQPVPDVDYRRRLVGELRVLEAEVAAERTAETYAPLTEQALAVRQGQLALVRLLLDHDNSRADLMRRRRVATFISGSGTDDDDGGNRDVPQRRVSIDLGMEL